MFGDLGKIMKVARDMKEKMPAMKQQMEAQLFTAQAGGGAVCATVNGKMVLADLKISPELLAGGDAERLADLVKSAVSAAQAQVAQAVAAMMHELTGGADLSALNGLLGV